MTVDDGDRILVLSETTVKVVDGDSVKLRI